MKGKEEPQDAYELIAASEVKTGSKPPPSRSHEIRRQSERDGDPPRSPREGALWPRSGGGDRRRSGVGKSRIILEMRHMFPECTYLEGRCLHYGGSMAYLPFLDILRSYFGIKEGERESPIKRKMKEKLASLDEN